MYGKCVTFDVFSNLYVHEHFVFSIKTYAGGIRILNVYSITQLTTFKCFCTEKRLGRTLSLGHGSKDIDGHCYNYIFFLLKYS
jgi:hypothetical protein